MKKFNIRIEGLVPLLQAKHLSPQDQQKILARESGPKQKVKDLTDKEQFEMHAYKNENGEFVQPSEMIEAAMAKAATNFRFEGKKTYKDLIKSGIVIEQENLLHLIQDFKADERYAVNKNTRGAVWVVRPKAEKWALEFNLDLLQDEQIEVGVLKQILIYAGMYVGIGAWRPKFGRFEVKKFEEI